MIPSFVWPLIVIFILHFLGDWVFQSKKMGKEKSEKHLALFFHFLIYTATLSLVVPFLDESLFTRISFVVLNGLLHVGFDGSWWRLYKLSVWKREYGHIKTWGIYDKEIAENKLKSSWEYWNDSVFGYFLGFDQMFHFCCLTITYFLFF